MMGHVRQDNHVRVTIMEDLSQGSTILQLVRIKELTQTGIGLRPPGMESQGANQRVS